jgi:hypothetical protein
MAPGATENLRLLGSRRSEAGWSTQSRPTVFGAIGTAKDRTAESERNGWCGVRRFGHGGGSFSVEGPAGAPIAASGPAWLVDRFCSATRRRPRPPFRPCSVAQSYTAASGQPEPTEQTDAFAQVTGTVQAFCTGQREVGRTSRAVRRVLWSGRLAALPRPAAIHLGLPSPAGSCGLPAGSGGLPSNACAGRSPAPLDLAPGGVYRAARVTPGAGGLLHHRFTLTAPRSGGLFSVALSRGSPRVGVANHPALWSPDVPRRDARTPTRPPARLVRRTTRIPEFGPQTRAYASRRQGFRAVDAVTVGGPCR